MTVNGISGANNGMQAMISADSSMKQAKVQGSMATQMEGKAGVLESEMKIKNQKQPEKIRILQLI